MAFIQVDGNCIPVSCVLDPFAHALGMTGGAGKPHIGLGTRFHLSNPHAPLTDYISGGTPLAMAIGGAIKGKGYIGTTNYDSYNRSIPADSSYTSSSSSSSYYPPASGDYHKYLPTFSSPPEKKPEITKTTIVEIKEEKKAHLHDHGLVETVNVAIIKKIGAVLHIVLFESYGNKNYYFPHASVVRTMSSSELANRALYNWSNGVVNHEYIEDDTRSYEVPLDAKIGKNQKTFLKNIDSYPVDYIYEMLTKAKTKNSIFSNVTDIITVPVDKTLMTGFLKHPKSGDYIALSADCLNSINAIFARK